MVKEISHHILTLSFVSEGKADGNPNLRNSMTGRLFVFCCLKYLGKSDENNGKTRHLAVGRPRIIKKKGFQKLSRVVKQIQRQTVGQLTAQYEVNPSTSVSEYSAQRT
ncbi:hypothetical protein TNCV_1634151 [Trichonephila clavipes]|nr:hypothetical protein TNCV_1634151 [Trichonephila clavipes]